MPGQRRRSKAIYVLESVDAGISQYGAPKSIAPDRFGTQLQEFVESVGDALKRVSSAVENYSLDEVTIKGTFDAEVGFALISRAAVGGGIELKFKRISPVS